MRSPRAAAGTAKELYGAMKLLYLRNGENPRAVAGHSGRVRLPDAWAPRSRVGVGCMPIYAKIGIVIGNTKKLKRAER